MTLLIPQSHFRVPPNPDAHLTSRFGKTMRCNQTTLMADHKNKLERVRFMDIYCVVESLSFSIHDLEWSLTLFPRRTSDTMSQLAISHIVLSLTSRKYHLSLWERKGNDCIANIFIVCLDLCTRWIMTMSYSFMLQHTPSMRSYDYLNLLMLWNVSSVISSIFGHMYNNIMEWHVLVWIVTINFNNEVLVLGTIHGNRCASFFPSKC